MEGIRLGGEIPDFMCETTEGDFGFYEFLVSEVDRPWTLLFSHPADFTPVCTTEFGRTEKILDRFTELGIKLIGVSCDEISDHHLWSKDILYREGLEDQAQLRFPIIADKSREIVTKLGMLDPREISQPGMPLPARAVMLLDKRGVIRLAVLYPAAVGRSYEEILRASEAVILNDRTGLATPVEWTPGEECLVPASMTLVEAENKFGKVQTETLPSGKEYMRKVKYPQNLF